MKTAMLRFLNEHEWPSGAAASEPMRGLSPVLDTHSVDLRSIVEARVIPRLRETLGSRSVASPPSPLTNRDALPPLDWLAERLVTGDDAAVVARIAAARREGSSLEQVYLEWLMPTAAYLDAQLTADLRGLAETTLAFCVLQHILRDHAHEFCAETEQPDTGLRALLVAPSDGGGDAGLPVFGLLLMSQFFRREGWEARAERDIKGVAFRDAVLNEWFDLVEVLATSDRDLDAIKSGIRLIRRGSPNPEVGVIACGRIFDEHPELVRMVGADRSASDPLSSLSQAKLILARGTGRHLLS